MDRHDAVSRSYMIPGFMWPGELCWLFDAFRSSRTHVEVGSFCGRSLFASCGGMSESTVYSVDVLKPGMGLDLPDSEWASSVFAATCGAIRQSKGSRFNLEVLQDGSVQAARLLASQGLRGVIDSVFIDGLHHYEHTAMDIQEWLPLIKAGGIISGHDYSTMFPGVMDAVHEFVPGFQVIPDTRIWFAKTALT